MTNEDEVFGYQDGGEQLADYAERFGLLFDRLRAIRSVMPESAAVVPQRVKDELIDDDVRDLNYRIRDLDAAIAHRTEVSLQLGVLLPLELLRERFGLTQLDVEILSMVYALETGGAFNPYDTRSNQTEHVAADVSLMIALLAGGDRAVADQVRTRLSGDAPLVESGMMMLGPSPGWGAVAPLMYKRLRLGERTVEFLSGVFAPPRSVLGTAATYQAEPPGEDALLLDDPQLVERAARALSRSDQVVVLRGAAGVGRKSIAYAAARRMGRGVLVIDLTRVTLDAQELARTLVT